MSKKAKKDATPATAKVETPTPATRKATPARKDGKIGPDPKALSEGRMNPEREGKVFEAIRNGLGSTVSELMAATGLRNPTVRYFGISAGEAGILDAIRIGSEYRFVVRANDPKATAKAKEVRAAVLALRDAATATPKKEDATPAK